MCLRKNDKKIYLHNNYALTVQISSLMRQHVQNDNKQNEMKWVRGVVWHNNKLRTANRCRSSSFSILPFLADKAELSWQSYLFGECIDPLLLEVHCADQSKTRVLRHISLIQQILQLILKHQSEEWEIMRKWSNRL